MTPMGVWLLKTIHQTSYRRTPAQHPSQEPRSELYQDVSCNRSGVSDLMAEAGSVFVSVDMFKDSPSL
jgi:hypothetical protein